MESVQKFPWEAHKEELRRLFLAEDRSLSDVMVYMEKEHNFRGRYLYVNPQNDSFSLKLFMAAKHNMNAISKSGSFERTSKIPSGNLSIIESRRGRGVVKPATFTLMVS
jgi:hypothetical protein